MTDTRATTADAWALVANLKVADRKGVREGEKLWLAWPNHGNGLDRNLMRSNRTGLEKWVRADRLTDWRIAWVRPAMREHILTLPEKDHPNLVADVAWLSRRSLIGNPLAEAETMSGMKALRTHVAALTSNQEIANAA